MAEGKGILDRAYAERRFGFISDCTGHAKPVDFQSCKNYSNMTLFESFAKDFIYRSLNALEFPSIDLLKTDLQKVVLKELDDKALDLGLGGTFHMAYIAEVNHKKVVITVDAGDSTLWLVRGKEVQKLSQQNDERKSLGSMNTSDGCSFRVFEVQEGDRIVGMTDFTDFLPEDEVKKMIAEKSTAHDIVLEFKKLLGSEGEVLEKGQKEHDPSDPTKSDDMGVFVLIV